MSTDYKLLRTLLQLSRTRTDATENYITECTKFLSNRKDGEQEDDYRNIQHKLDRAIADKSSK